MATAEKFESVTLVREDGHERVATSAAGQIALEFDGYRIKKGQTDLAEKATTEAAKTATTK